MKLILNLESTEFAGIFLKYDLGIKGKPSIDLGVKA